MIFRIQLKPILASVLLLVASLTCTQKVQSQTKGLSYKWEINPANEKTKQAQTNFVLINTSGMSISSKNWGIYFNAIKVPTLSSTAALQYHIKHINGDLHYLYPSEKFTRLGAGQTQKIEFIVPDIRNYTELPTGFFSVFKGGKAQAVLLTNLSKPTNTVEIKIATDSYLKNSVIRNIPEEELIKIFPSPVNYQEKDGFFTINGQTQIIANDAFKAEASVLQKDMFKLLLKELVITGPTSNSSNKIILHKKPLGKAYSLLVSKDSIVISAANNEGIFYGIQSLKTLISPSYYASPQNQVKLKAVQVLDSARFQHRALLMDVARNFQPKSEVLKTLDMMALYKLNVLHFHLIDDEGWRLEIPGLPELTTIGATRGFATGNGKILPPSYGSGPASNKGAGSGYYTTADFKEILKYATERHIKVIPEIETPGHARASIKAMDARFEKYTALGQPEKASQYLLRDLDDKSVYRSVQGWNDNVINVAMPSIYTFLEKVINEITLIYKDTNSPLEYIHMGGDEVPSGVWGNSPIVKKLMMADTTIKDVNDLWRYYFKKTNAILQTRNISLYGWEEVDLKHVLVNGKKTMIVDTAGSVSNYQVDVWNNIIGTGSEDLAYRLANAGFKTILSNVTNLYLDMAYNKSFNEHGMNWAGYVDTDKPFSFIPYDYYKSITENEYGLPVSQNAFTNKVHLNENAKPNIAGLQAALWGETLTDTLKFEYLLLPKLLAFAERAWSTSPQWATVSTSTLSSPEYNEAWSKLVNSSGKRELPRLDYYGFKYRIPEPGIMIKNGVLHANVQLPGMTIRYTTDGTEPNSRSLIYSKPISAKGKIALRVFNSSGRSGKIVVVDGNPLLE